MWERYSLGNDKWYCWELGGSLVFLKKSTAANNLFRYDLAFKQASFPDDAAAGVGECHNETTPLGLQCKELFTNAGVIEIAIDLPPEPFVVSCKDAVVLQSNAEAIFFAPLCPIINFVIPDGAVLSSCTPFKTPKTWWGRDVTSGKFCYSLPGRLFPFPHDAFFTQKVNPLLVLCPVVIKNVSKKLFAVETIRLDTEQLSIYEVTESGLLFSDIIEIEVTDNEWRINVRAANTNPGIYSVLCNGKKVRCISMGDKTDTGKIIRRRSAEFIKNITQF
jgi:hypothetical protein